MNTRHITVNEYMKNLPENQLLEAARLYQERFSETPATAYYKAIERLTKRGELAHLAKGIYYRPKKSRFGVIPVGEESIVQYYMQDGHAMLIGYRLYQQKGLTTQLSRNIELLCDSISGERKTIGNVRITRAQMKLTPNIVPVIETLEILQNYKRIEDINMPRFFQYMKEFADCYSQEAADKVLHVRKYKKSTIAFLKAVLDNFGVKNSLGQYLSALSTYHIPNLEDLHAFAPV